MTESELEETLKILYRTDHYLYECLCIHLIKLDKKINRYEKALKAYGDEEGKIILKVLGE